MSRTGADAMGNPPFSQWRGVHQDVGVQTLRDAAIHGEIVVNATAGIASKDALDAAGADNLAGKVVIDVSNAIDPASSSPLTLFVANTDSLGEQLQAAFPQARFVKTWNTMSAGLMCNPGAVADGDHTIMLCGNDDEAKTVVRSLLEAFGWKHVLDLGDIGGARAMEGYLLLWLRAMGAMETHQFNVKFVR